MKRIFYADNNAVMIEHDYAEALKAEFDMENYSETFGFNHTLSIYGSTWKYYDNYHNGVSKKGNVNMDFHSGCSDDSAHNAATTFEHIKKFIHCMYDDNLFIKDVIIYDNTYQCIKQYIRENAMWLLSVLAFT